MSCNPSPNDTINEFYNHLRLINDDEEKKEEFLEEFAKNMDILLDKSNGCPDILLRMLRIIRDKMTISGSDSTV